MHVLFLIPGTGDFSKDLFSFYQRVVLKPNIWAPSMLIAHALSLLLGHFNRHKLEKNFTKNI